MPTLAQKLLLFGAQTYASKITNLFGGSIIGWWDQGEASGTASLDRSTSPANGTYSNVTLAQPGIGDGQTSALYNGTSSRSDIGATGFPAKFNGLEGAIGMWLKVSAVGVWTDATARNVISISVDGTTTAQLLRDASNNSFTFGYNAGGVSRTRNATSQTTVDWFHVILSWSDSGDAMWAYLNGAAVGAVQTIGTWAGTPATNRCFIGSRLSGADFWSGYIQHPIVLNRAPTAAEALIWATR